MTRQDGVPKRYDWLSLLALLTLVVVLPAYGWQEYARMRAATAELVERDVTEGSEVYVNYCAECHGVSGEGRGQMPMLSNPALADADSARLFDVIARATHGSNMAAWHRDEGGALNDYQINQLVTLIQRADWEKVEQVAESSGFVPSQQSTVLASVSLLNVGDENDPHRCSACHEEPLVHAERFGQDCQRCHTLEAWKPGLLTHHVFRLDHGQESADVTGAATCQACHVATYASYGCYECHDHQPAEMEEVHLAEAIVDFVACAECHPTGRPEDTLVEEQVQGAD